MRHTTESGKAKLLKGTLVYLWEEMKTMNKTKFKALKSMMSGYLSLKFKKKRHAKGPRNSISLIER